MCNLKNINIVSDTINNAAEVNLQQKRLFEMSKICIFETLQKLSNNKQQLSLQTFCLKNCFVNLFRVALFMVIFVINKYALFHLIGTTTASIKNSLIMILLITEFTHQ